MSPTKREVANPGGGPASVHPHANAKCERRNIYVRIDPLGTYVVRLTHWASVHRREGEMLQAWLQPELVALLNRSLGLATLRKMTQRVPK